MIKKEISIPTDNDGFILLKCSFCGEFFKLKLNEMRSENNIFIWCPSCGLISENYITEDVLKLALKISKNIISELVFNEMKEWERKSRNGNISFKVGKELIKEIENPIVSGVEALEIQKYNCCKKSAKIKSLIKIVGSYCPYCGVKYDEFE